VTELARYSCKCGADSSSFTKQLCALRPPTWIWRRPPASGRRKSIPVDSVVSDLAYKVAVCSAPARRGYCASEEIASGGSPSPLSRRHQQAEDCGGSGLARPPRGCGRRSVRFVRIKREDSAPELRGRKLAASNRWTGTV